MGKESDVMLQPHGFVKIWQYIDKDNIVKKIITLENKIYQPVGEWFFPLDFSFSDISPIFKEWEWGKDILESKGRSVDRSL